MRLLVLFAGAALCTACATNQPVKHPVRNPALLGAIPVGMDKAEVLKTFGAPIKIEIVDRKFKYTYFKTRTSKVMIHFDEQNKVAEITR